DAECYKSTGRVARPKKNTPEFQAVAEWSRRFAAVERKDVLGATSSNVLGVVSEDAAPAQEPQHVGTAIEVG
ncbi:unnamed protein product, partial [Amoebophrya sp. A120]